MTPFLQLAIVLAIIIFMAKLGGYFSYRLGQPSVLGELLVGIILGPSVIDLVHLPIFTDQHLGEIIHELAEIGVLLLMFIAGLEVNISDLAKSGKVSALAGVLGVVVPVALGTGIGLLLNIPLNASIFLGLTLAATSVSISAQTLMELKVLHSRVGVGMLGAAVFDDVLVVLLLSIFVALAGSGSTAGGGSVMGILLITLRMVLFLVGGTAVGMWLIPRLSRKVSELPISQGVIAFTMVVILLYGWASEYLGSMAAITGSFLAGLVLARSPVHERIESGISALAYGMFVPIFFINVGLSANARELTGETLILFFVMTLVAVVGKVAGAGYGAYLSGFNRREALQLGVGMMSRGEVGLIVASVGVVQGLINQSTFSAVVGVVIITTLLTPPALRSLFRKPEPKVEPQPARTREVNEGEEA
jgi:Kef-type K+ transport system membrane component KefB